MLATNHKPIIKGTDLAIWRRLNLVPFDQTISDAEKDRRLDDKLGAESDGILAWAIEGLRAYNVVGLNPPSVVKDKTQEYKNESDDFGQFLSESVVVDAESNVVKTQLFYTYKLWCNESGVEFKMTAQTLNRKMIDRGYKDGRDSKSRWWCGLRLIWKSDDAGDTDAADSTDINMLGFDN